jgi:hypothetical protein
VVTLECDKFYDASRWRILSCESTQTAEHIEAMGVPLILKHHLELYAIFQLHNFNFSTLVLRTSQCISEFFSCPGATETSFVSMETSEEESVAFLVIVAATLTYSC